MWPAKHCCAVPFPEWAMSCSKVDTEAVVISGEYDAVVVGAGVMGSAIAYHLAKRRRRVLLLEQFDFLHRRGSSHGESRIIRRTYPEDWYTAMMGEAYELWDEVEAAAGTRVLTRTGSLDFGPAHNKDLQAVLAGAVKYGVPHEVLPPAEVHARFGVSIPPDNVGVFCQEGGVLNATKAVATLQRLAVAEGAVVVDNAGVRRVDVGTGEGAGAGGARGGGGRLGHTLADGRGAVVVETARGTVKAHRCILAAGAWTAQLVQSITGQSIPVEPIHTTVAYWRCGPPPPAATTPNSTGGSGKAGSTAEAAVHPPPFSAAAGFPVFINYDDPYVYGMPVLELPGLIKASLHSGSPCSPDRAPIPDVKAAVDAVGPFLRARFGPLVDASAPVVAEACMYSMTPDQDFILDALPVGGGGGERPRRGGREDGVVLVAAGFSGHGFKFAPLVGKIMADLAETGDSESAPLELFSLARFERSPSGNKKVNGPQVRPLAPAPARSSL